MRDYVPEKMVNEDKSISFDQRANFRTCVQINEVTHTVAEFEIYKM